MFSYPSSGFISYSENKLKPELVLLKKLSFKSKKNLKKCFCLFKRIKIVLKRRYFSGTEFLFWITKFLFFQIF